MAGKYFGAYIASHAAETPDRVALIFEEQSWTYAELDAAVASAKRAALSLGVAPQDRVVVQGALCPEAVITIFALARVGAVVVPVHPHSSLRELNAVLDQVSPRAVIGGADFLAIARPWPSMATLHWSDVCSPDAAPDPAALGPAAPSAPPAPEPDQGDTAMLLFTSGTTGVPKGIALTHANLWWTVQNGLASLPLGAQDVAMIATPLAHVAALSGLPQCVWARGGTVVLAPRFDVGRFVDLVREHGVTTTFAVPQMLVSLVRHPRFLSSDLDSLRWVLVGGAPPVEWPLRRMLQRGIPVINSYGLTEASAGVTYASLSDVAERPLTAGRPGPHVEVSLATSTGGAVPSGSTGEILVRGPSVATSYWVHGQLVATPSTGGWLRTGDRGRFDAEGRLEVVGRIDDLIVTGGENVDPLEVEHALSDMRDITELAVAGLPDAFRGEVVSVFVVSDLPIPSLQELQDHVQDRLAPHKWPRRVYAVPHLPRSSNGKVQRHKLREIAMFLTA